jgi:CheY-like chemotaxis protein
MPKIVIIEDDQAISQMYRFRFESEGYSVETAVNGQLGLNVIEKMQPDIVLLDLIMPEMGGVEMLEVLRQKPWGKLVKVIILTNVGEQEIPDHIRTLGISNIIIKANMTPRQVVDAVKQALSASNSTPTVT